MATVEEGGAIAKITTTTSSYGGGGEGTGGKLRKKPFRRTTTPYDRPSTALRQNDNNGTWLTNASKLISYGAHSLYESVFRKRLPAPPPPRTSEINNGLIDGLPEAVPLTQYGAQEPTRGGWSQPTNGSSSSGISELEQLLKQKTFTRSEIDRLMDLLQSKAGEVSLRDDGKRNEEITLRFGRGQQFASSLLEGNMTEGDSSHGFVSTPISCSKVLEDSIASPAELAKAYMGSRPSKVSPSMLGMRSHVSRENTSLLGTTRFTSKSPIMSLTTKDSAGLAASDNGFITPRSRGRSAIYNMSRPSSRVHPTSTFKGHGINSNGYAGLAMSSAPLSLMEPDGRFEPKPMTLKRRRSVLDDDVGSVSSIRRIRQRSNLIAPRIPYSADGVGIDSNSVLVSSKQKLPLIGEQKYVSNTVGENADDGLPSTSYGRVPSKSSEVAARILQHLENLTPKQKSSENKLVDVREKSPFKLTKSMLRGQALRSMEDVDSSKLLDVQDDHKLESRSNATLSDTHNSTSQEQGKVEENGPQESYTVMNKVSVVALKTFGPSRVTSDSVVKAGASEPPQKKRAFRMAAQEDYLELYDDHECNGLASRPFVEGGRGSMQAHLTQISPAKEPKLVGTTTQAEVKLPSGLILSKTSDCSPGAVTVGKGSSSITLPAIDEATAVAKAAVFPVSVAEFDKPKETNNLPPLFSYSSKVADKLTSESISRMPETKPESSGSMVNVSSPSASLVKIPALEKGDQLNPSEAEGRNPDAVPFASSNGSLHSSPLTGSFPAASLNDANKKSTGGVLLTPSTSIENLVPTGTGASTSTTPSGSIFGSAAASSILTGSAFKFGASVEPCTAVSATSTTIVPVGGDSKTKVEIGPSSGSSSSSLSNTIAFGAASSGHNTFLLGSSICHSTANDLQGSLFGSAGKSFLSGAGTVSQGTPILSVSPALSPSFNMNSGSSFVSSLSSPLVFNANTSSDFSSPASLSDVGAVIPCNEPTSSPVVFGMNSNAVSDSSAASSSSGATPSIFSFGFSSSSSSTNAVGSTGGTTPPVFNFGGSLSPSVVNTASSFSSGTSGIFNFGESSLPSINSVSPNSAPSDVFGSSWQNSKSSIFGSLITSASPSTGFSFSSSLTASTPTNAAPIVFSSSMAPSSSPAFSFTSSASVLSSPAPTLAQSVFGNAPPGFAASPGNNDQMNAEDSMVEDLVQSAAPSVPVFGQTSVIPAPSGFMFGSTVPTQANPFQFGIQQNQVAPQNSSLFQASNSLEFNAGGSFSLGSGGGDKSARKFVKISKSKNRRK